jgi:hypothetical protein
MSVMERLMGASPGPSGRASGTGVAPNAPPAEGCGGLGATFSWSAAPPAAAALRCTAQGPPC